MTTEPDPLARLQTAEENAKAAGIAFLRLCLGVLWLFEVTVGKNWILGGFGSDVHPGWLGAERGSALRDNVTEAIADGTWSGFALLYDILLGPSAPLFAGITVVLQVAFAVAFLFGVLVRPMALLALGMDLAILLLGNATIPPFFVAMHLFVLATGAGRYHGVDGWLLRRLGPPEHGWRHALWWLIELPFLRARWRSPALATTALLALYFFLAIPGRETTRIQLVSLVLAAILGIVAFALYASNLIPDRLGIIVSALRIFVGFQLLLAIWAPVTLAIDGLPGWASGAELRAVLEDIAAHHWPVVGQLVEVVLLPAPGVWAFAFGALQLVVGVLLLLGLRTRGAALVAAGYLTVLLLLGFTRTPPFLLVLLVPILALDGGRYLSVDRVHHGFFLTERYGLPIPKRLVVPLLVLGTANAVAAAITAFVAGIEPGAYLGSLPSMVTAMVAILSGALAGVGWLQQRHTPAPATEAARDFLRSGL
jgi:uncharacterized membrane protein YphA (DoxX/SURF4 family)